MSGQKGDTRMALRDLEIKKAKPKEKSYNLKDEDGLYLEVKPSGKKYWRFRYWLNTKENRMSLGEYPVIPLADARQRRDEKRRLIADGIDPVLKNKEEKAATSQEHTLEAVAREWAARFAHTWTEGHAELTLRRLELNIFPYLGQRPIQEITAPELLQALRRIETRGALEVARRVRGICSMVFRYAVASGLAERDPAADLRGALAPPAKRHFATITDPKGIGQLMRDIDQCKASFPVYCALRLAPLLFVRPGELRHAEWAEFDLAGAEWRIPAAKMKMRAAHLVPLARQAIAILEELRQLTGNGKYLFPSLRTSARPMSDNTVNVALRRLGYAKEELTGHGFRAMASTLLNEQGWNRDAIERQLAHGERDKVRAAYNHAEFLPERRRMMQAWADYLDMVRKTCER